MAAGEFGAYLVAQERCVRARRPDPVPPVEQGPDQELPSVDLLDLVEKQIGRTPGQGFGTLDKSGKIFGTETEQAGVFKITEKRFGYRAHVLQHQRALAAAPNTLQDDGLGCVGGQLRPKRPLDLKARRARIQRRTQDRSKRFFQYHWIL